MLADDLWQSVLKLLAAPPAIVLRCDLDSRFASNEDQHADRSGRTVRPPGALFIDPALLLTHLISFPCLRRGALLEACRYEFSRLCPIPPEEAAFGIVVNDPPARGARQVAICIMRRTALTAALKEAGDRTLHITCAVTRLDGEDVVLEGLLPTRPSFADAWRRRTPLASWLATSLAVLMLAASSSMLALGHARHKARADRNRIASKVACDALWHRTKSRSWCAERG